MIKPTDNDIGRKVIYNVGHKGAKNEYGTISSFTEFYVFVLYGNSYNGIANKRENLRWDK